jgi:drug/metabolite transporter (DMT)-like permease
VGLSARDLVLLGLLTLAWGVNWPVMKLGVQDFAPLTFRTISMAGGLVVLWVVIRVQGHRFFVAPQFRRELIKIGFFNMVAWFVLSIYGVKLLSSGRAAILGYTLPIWTALIGWWVFSENPGKRLWLGVAAAGLGVMLLLSSEFSTITGKPIGTVLMLSAAALWGYGTHLMRKRAQQTAVQVITFWSLLQAFVVCSVLCWLLERNQWVRLPNQTEWLAMAYNSLVIFGFAQVMWFRLATILPPVASGLSVMLIPVTGLFSGMWMLGERPAWQDWIALVCILAAIATVLLPSRKSVTV